MSVTIKTLFQAKFAQSANTNEYSAPSNMRTIIDKFTATNTDSSSVTLSVYLIPSGQAVADHYQIIKELSIAAGATRDLVELQNHILSPSETINVIAGTAGKVVIRASGREVTV